MYGIDLETDGYAATGPLDTESYSRTEDLSKVDKAGLKAIGFSMLGAGCLAGFLNAESHWEDELGNRVYTDDKGLSGTDYFIQKGSGEYVHLPDDVVHEVTDNVLAEYELELGIGMSVGFIGALYPGGADPPFY